MNPRHPVYIISKGRAESRLTSKALDRLGVPYHIVVEPQEYDLYAEHIEADKILQLPFSNLGQGSIPARNWVWDDAIRRGATSHWILDDNMYVFHRLNHNTKIRVTSGTIFRAAEDFVARYENVPVAGFNYNHLKRSDEYIPPLHINTRVYSCLLIRNDLIHRWRGRYNEDTDLSLRVLKSGWCTILFNAFLCKKEQTLACKGGNTDELYVGDGRLKMAESLAAQHPDVARVVWKWGRWQHYVDYSSFRHNRLRLKPGITPVAGNNEYGMVLQRCVNEEWVPCKPEELHDRP